MADKPDNNQLELLDARDYAEYLLQDPLEISAVLLGLVKHRTIITAYPKGANSFLLTSLLGVDNASQTLFFDPSPDDDINRLVQATERLTFSALLEQVKIQFDCGPLRPVEFGGYPAFAAALPSHLLRLQRREYFRLITPVTHSLTCNIPVQLDEGGVKTFEARVLDISGGGVGVLVPPRGMSINTDMEFADCSLILPEMGEITAQLRIRNVFQVTNRNGITMTRAGCQFIELPPGADNTIQRYILRIERERGARGKTA